MAKLTYFFQYQIPAENHTTGKSDVFINVMGSWNDKSFYDDGKPLTYAEGVNLTLFDCLQIKDWHIAYREINRIVQNHFSEIARAQRRAMAEEILKLEENPVLERMAFNYAEA